MGFDVLIFSYRLLLGQLKQDISHEIFLKNDDVSNDSLLHLGIDSMVKVHDVYITTYITKVYKPEKMLAKHSFLL